MKIHYSQTVKTAFIISQSLNSPCFHCCRMTVKAFPVYLKLKRAREWLICIQTYLLGQYYFYQYQTNRSPYRPRSKDKTITRTKVEAISTDCELLKLMGRKEAIDGTDLCSRPGLVDAYPFPRPRIFEKET